MKSLSPTCSAVYRVCISSHTSIMSCMVSSGTRGLYEGNAARVRMSSALRCFASDSQTPQMMYGVMSSAFICDDDDDDDDVDDDTLCVGCMRMVMMKRGKSTEEQKKCSGAAIAASLSVSERAREREKEREDVL